MLKAILKIRETKGLLS